MARDVNWDDPTSWDDDDKAWLRDRIDRVKPEYRSYLQVEAPPAPPAEAGLSPELDRLHTFLAKHYPEELSIEGQTPIGLALALLMDQAGVDDSDLDETEDPGYEKWKADELTTEIGRRRQAGRDIPKVANKTEAAAALRGDDATNGPFPRD